MKTINVVLNQDEDETVIQRVAEILRSNNAYARQVRDFADTLENDQSPRGLTFQPYPGQILICHFGLGFQKPEIVKTRPVIVVSPKQRRWSGLCTVVPISSKAPDPPEAYHFRLPNGTLPGEKYVESWIKADLVTTVAKHRLDRIKVGFRDYQAPVVADEVLREVRRCVLHAGGMHNLTKHL